MDPTVVPAAPFSGPMLAGIPLEFFFFALTLVGVAVFHHQTHKG